MFRQTVTISADVLRQFNGAETARPKKSVIYDGDGNGGGIVVVECLVKFFNERVKLLALLLTGRWRSVLGRGVSGPCKTVTAPRRGFIFPQAFTAMKFPARWRCWK